MWILECDGDVLEGKRRWLKPGSRWLFGRNQVEETTPNEFSFAIKNNTISRKHLAIEVAPVVLGQAEVFTRSTITMLDDSKIGTHIDGLLHVKESYILPNRQHVFRLGRAEIDFRITWHPITFTFNLAHSRADETLQRYQERFVPLDIPTTGVYVTAETTHVMAGKRNTPKGLRALVNGKYLVTTAFSDAVEKAATKVPGEEAAPLEQDFDANWPKEVEYLPPPASEPHPRPVELFKPDADRQTLFRGFTFIFATQLLWDNLHPMVLDGGAKALKYEVEMGETRVEDFVQFVLDAAEKKGLRSLGDTTQAKGVVFVRFRGEGVFLDWSVRFIESVDAQLEQRSIEQNEFLDAILTKDVSKLRQPLQEEESQDLAGTRAPPSTAVPRTMASSTTTTTARAHRQSPQPSQSAAQEPAAASQAPRTAASQLRARRVITTSRFKGFDDFDASQFSRRKSQVQEINDGDEEDEVEAAPSQSQAQSVRRASNTNNDSQSLFISDSQDGPSQPNNTQYSATSVNPRKRRAPPSPSPEPAPDDEEDALDAMFPAAAAMKKRRLEDEAAGRSKTNLSQTANDLAASQAPATKAKARKPPKELDVRNAAKIRAEALDAKREGSEKEEQKMTTEEIAAFRPDFQMATLSLRERPEAITATDEDRIDPRWVGRKNFKKFVKSRPGSRNDNDAASSFVVNNRARKVIVTLEEAKRKTYGLGEEDYFLEPKSNSKRRGGASQSQSESQARGKDRRNQQLDATTNVHSADEQEADDDIEPEEIAGQPREGPVAAALRRLGGNEEPETQTTQTQASTRKRAAPATKSAPPSKIRSGSGRAPVVSRGQQEDDDDDDSEEEEVVFKLRRPVRG